MEMEHFHGIHDPLLVFFSYIVAVVASYTALDLTGRIMMSKGIKSWLWLISGSVAMGMGIWSMHFVGMMAYELPMSLKYDVEVVLLSMLPSIIGSFIALLIVGRSKQLGIWQLLGGGVLLAAGVTSMHYIGMAAMQIGITYDISLFLLSILIALVASITALWLSFYFRKAGERGAGWKKIGSGLIMGAAIAGLHYTGMIAAHFYVKEDMDDAIGVVFDQKLMAYFISGATLFILGLCLLGIFISKRFSIKESLIQLKTDENYMINQELLQLNEHLEQLVQERTAQLEKAHDEAIKANMIKSQFLANMSHELRTPLNAIIGYSEMLREDAEDLGQETFVEDLKKISQAGKHLLTIINDILDISKIEAEKLDVYIETSDLPELIQDVVDTVSPLIRGNHNQLEVQSVDGEITTDITKLRQILINLIGNASKFTNAGHIKLSLFHEIRDGQTGYGFSIADNGIGMTEEQVDKLFQPFTQGDSSTTRKYGGTGLGLAISQRYAQIMGGEITVKSQFGIGSTFTCWLPSAIAEPVRLNETVMIQNEIQQDSQDHTTTPISILLIDDEPVNRQLLERYFDKEGWTLAFADSGQRGIALAKKLRPKVICLDILMPSMDGWSVLSALKSDPVTCDIPVVIWSITSDKHLGYTLGASEYLTKPVDRDRLFNILHKYVAERHSHKILVIEDDATTSELMTKLLQKEKYEVAQAGNGRIALEYMQQEVPSLILLDLMMPEMDGFQFIAELKKNKEWGQIPIVVMTAKTITAQDRLKLNGYVNNIIQKGSFDYQALLVEIRKFMDTPKKDT